MNTKTLGWIYLIIGVPAFLSFILSGHPQYAVWFSNHSFIILGIALLFSSRFWVMAELCLGLIPELIWNIDYLAKLFTGEYIWGFTSYMFTDTGSFAWAHLYSLQHVLFIPAGLFALYLLKGSIRHSYLGSLLHGGIIWGLSFLMPGNINCVYENCLPILIPYYIAVWPTVVIACIS